MEKDILIYVKNIAKDVKTNISTEHTFRPALKQLLDSYKRLSAINEPKRQNIGMPDFLISSVSFLL